MRLVATDEGHLGVVVNDRFVDLVKADALRQPSPDPARGSLFYADSLARFIEAGDSALAEAENLADFVFGEAEELAAPLTAISLAAPWPQRRIACTGGNFAEHGLGMHLSRPGAEPATIDDIYRRSRSDGQWGFFKVPARVAGPEDAIPYPSRTSYLDYEGELAVVIGRKGKDIRAEDALEHIYGVTLLNDFSIRDDKVPPRTVGYSLSKNFDGSVALGPAIATGVDPAAVIIETRVNGELRQRYRVADMIFTFAEVIAYLSRDFTLVPGDIISGGTSAGTAQDSSPRRADGSLVPDRFLRPHDSIEVLAPEVGSLHITISEPTDAW